VEVVVPIGHLARHKEHLPEGQGPMSIDPQIEPIFVQEVEQPTSPVVAAVE